MEARRFTMHQRSHHATVAGVFVFLLAVESLPVHLLLAQHAAWPAWAATASSLWVAYYIVADVRAVRRQPLVLEPEGLRFAIGLRWRGLVPYASIARVTRGSGRDDPQLLRATVVGAADLVLVLTEPLEAEGPFRLRRRYRKLALSVDDPDALAAALTEAGRAALIAREPA
jgi:hypothetical protein